LTALEEVTSRFWSALYERDWTRIRGFFNDKSIYYDVPTGPASAARGPDGIEARLRLGLDGLAGYDHGPARIATGDGGLVITEHAETWRWDSGESVTLPFVSVQQVAGEVITVWKDYWDYATLINAAPAAWMDRLANADLSWLFDATGVA
jgi:limonene-1,2-epoxide hydrolase